MVNFCHHYLISGSSLVAGGIFLRQIFVPFFFFFFFFFLSFSIHFEICQFSARKRIWPF